jgi:hypothetical protein
MKPMTKRQAVAALLRQQCRKLNDSGKHEKWGWPLSCRQHVTSLPQGLLLIW